MMSARRQESEMHADEQAIRQLLAHWHQATAAGDVDAVAPLMSEDAVFLTPGGTPLRGRSAFLAQLRQLLASHRIASSGDVQEIAVAGDLAYCWSVLDVRVTPKSGGAPMARAGHTLSILRKGAEGRWQLTRDANLLPTRS
jgi:uncharacterized protein (TIGR02246 family)